MTPICNRQRVYNPFCLSVADNFYSLLRSKPCRGLPQLCENRNPPAGKVSHTHETLFRCPFELSHACESLPPYPFELSHACESLPPYPFELSQVYESLPTEWAEIHATLKEQPKIVARNKKERNPITEVSLLKKMMYEN